MRAAAIIMVGLYLGIFLGLGLCCAHYINQFKEAQAKFSQTLKVE